MAKRHELTERIEGRIPGKKGDPGRTGQDDRRFLNAVFFVLRTGIQWEGLPVRELADAEGALLPLGRERPW